MAYCYSVTARPLYQTLQYGCETCNRGFSTQYAAHQHMNATSHWAPPMWDCDTCDVLFDSWEDARRHMNYSNHWSKSFGCEGCGMGFQTRDAAAKHMDALGHRRPWVCEASGCEFRFSTFGEARRHMDSNNHWRSWWCGDCDRGFENENNLRQHLKSRDHLGTPIECPWCEWNFTTASGLVRHVESDSCLGREYDRRSLWLDIKRRDRYGLVTYQHQPTHYHCPDPVCKRPFSELAALFNHLESESCGYLPFEVVQESVCDFISGRDAVHFGDDYGI